MRVLVTGATGFIGRGVVASLAEEGYSVCSLVREASAQVMGSEDYAVADICSSDNDFLTELPGIDIVVHLAAKTQVLKSEATDPLKAFRDVNVEATRRLALAAAKKGVSRFIFMSSVKVNGEMTGGEGRPEAFSADSIPKPEDAYGISKLEAEQTLQAIARDTGLVTVIVRPPLVYGPSVGGNFLRLMRLAASGMPLPFGALHNRRSLVSLDNLSDLLVTCIRHPAAADKVVMAADGEDVSTTQLLRLLAELMGKPSRLFPIPSSLLELGLTLLGQNHVAQRLCGSLQVDIDKTRELLAWKPPLSIDEGLYNTVADFQRNSKGFTV